jgi:hypothetical protein
MKASCREVRTSVDRIAGIGGSLAKGERHPLSTRKCFETGSQNRFHTSCDRLATNSFFNTLGRYRNRRGATVRPMPTGTDGSLDQAQPSVVLPG